MTLETKHGILGNEKAMAALRVGETYVGAPPGVRQEDIAKIMRDPVRAAKLATLMEDTERVTRGVTLEDVMPKRGHLVLPSQVEDARRRRKQENLHRWRAKISPILEYYRHEIESNPDLSERNTMAALILTMIEHLEEWRDIQRAMKQLQTIFDHGAAILIRDDRGPVDERIKTLMKTLSLSFKGSEAIEAEVEPVLKQLDAQPGEHLEREHEEGGGEGAEA